MAPLVKHIAKLILKNDRSGFEDMIRAVATVKDNEQMIDEMRPLFVYFKPDLASVLKCSQAFYNNAIYRHGSVNTWAERNPELFDTDIRTFTQILDKYSIYITNNVPRYASMPTSEDGCGDNDEILKQLHTVIHHQNWFFDNNF